MKNFLASTSFSWVRSWLTQRIQGSLAEGQDSVTPEPREQSNVFPSGVHGIARAAHPGRWWVHTVGDPASSIGADAASLTPRANHMYVPGSDDGAGVVEPVSEADLQVDLTRFGFLERDKLQALVDYSLGNQLWAADRIPDFGGGAQSLAGSATCQAEPAVITENGPVTGWALTSLIATQYLHGSGVCEIGGETLIGASSRVLPIVTCYTPENGLMGQIGSGDGAALATPTGAPLGLSVGGG